MSHIPAILDVLAEIRDERARQVEHEGFNSAHDDSHLFGELPRAASVYALYASLPELDREHAKQFGPNHYGAQMLWPWDLHWLKLADPRRDLIKAAALIVAEIQRIDRERAEETAA